MNWTKDYIQQLRDDTPGCTHRIHLNNAGAGLMPSSVVSAIHEYIDLESRIGGYEAARFSRNKLDEFYIQTAKLLNTTPENIAFTSHATDSFNRALSAIPFAKGDLILTTEDDYASNQIAFLSLKKRLGIHIKRIPNGATGQLDQSAFIEAITSLQPKLVSITHMPTNSGLIQPIDKICEYCFEHKVWLLIDACQSLGQFNFDLQQLPCDFLSGTSRKFLRGPRGAGLLYVSSRVLEEGLAPLLPDMRGADWIEADTYKLREDAKRFEDWETAYALQIATTVAIRYALKIGINPISQRVQYLAQLLREKLGKLEKVQIADRGDQLSGIVTYHIPGKDPDLIHLELEKEGINSSVSSFTSGTIDFTKKNIPWALRVSPHYYNTEEELDMFVDKLSAIL